MVKLAFIYSILFYSISTASEIEIVGTKIFSNQIKKALVVLKNKAPDSYNIIKKYIGQIQESKRSGMQVYTIPPIYQISDRTAFYSVTWCAGTIAHDAYHSKLYHEYKKNISVTVPNDIWTGTDAEKACIKFQLQTLKLMNSPQHEIDYLQTLDGNHYDLNKNGIYDKIDYVKRDW